MEENKKKRSLLVRSVCGSCSITLLGAIFYLFLFGFELVAMTLMAASFSGLALTSAIVSDSILGFLSAILELFIEGICSVFSAIASIFNW